MILNYIIISVFIILFLLILLGLLRKPKLKPINILPIQTPANKNCLSEKVSCNEDNDCFLNCSEVSEGEEIICKALPDLPGLTDKQKKLLGNSETPQKYCVPAKAKMDCNIATGGIPLFSGWGNAGEMSFECMCSYPLWASSRICDPETGECTGNCLLNPGICEGGTFNWDLTSKVEPPIASLCQCVEGDTLLVDNQGLPRCVPSNVANFYNDLDISTGSSGGQPLLETSIQTKATYTSKCETGTLCNGKCCGLTNAVCCGNDLCCPTGYTCDIENKRCVKATCTGTKCGDSCCPISGGICSSDNKYCCPSSFPHPDPEKNTCNPNLREIESGKCTSNRTSCLNGCCPYTDGVCCPPSKDGKDYCCPADYPVCDLDGGMCRKN